MPPAFSIGSALARGSRRRGDGRLPRERGGREKARAVMQTILAQALPQRLHLGHRLIGLEERGERVEARFDNGTRVAADVVVGADGIHSTVRHALFGPDDPRFTGCVAYRGLVSAERV